MKAFGIPPAVVFRKSQTKAITITAAPASTPAQCLSPPRIPPARSEIKPHTIMVNATSTGAHTGPTQGSGMRNKMSQVLSECRPMNHQLQKRIEADVPNAERDGESRNPFVEIARHRQRNRAQHQHGCGFAPDLDRQAPRILRAGIGQLLLRDQRKQIVRTAFRMQPRADGIIDRAKIDHHGGLHVAERNPE